MTSLIPSAPDLGAELNSILAAELAAGNKVVTSNTPGGWPTIVLLDRPFLCGHISLPHFIRYRQINGPAPWKAHYINLGSGNVLACKPASPKVPRQRAARRIQKHLAATAEDWRLGVAP
jgi:hypothetical protein